MAAFLRFLLFSVLVLYFSNICHCKIVLPHKLRYLENMLNAEVVAKAAKIRQRMEANPSGQDRGKGWPMLLAQFQNEDKNKINSIVPNKKFGNLFDHNIRSKNFY